jgi:metal-responsive CopG/Arc/MetJ family transcriptional regulator
MKEKTSITLSSDLLAEVDKRAGSTRSRSAYIERALREHLRAETRRAIYERDLKILNDNADYFNREMEDVLRYRAPLSYESED